MSGESQSPTIGEKVAKDIREEWIRNAEVLLGVDMGIIILLRSKGMGLAVFLMMGGSLLLGEVVTLARLPE